MNKRNKTNTNTKTRIVIGTGEVVKTTTITKSAKPIYLKNDSLTIRGIKPKILEHKLYIDENIDEFGTGWDWFTSCDCENYIIWNHDRYLHEAFVKTKYEYEYHATRKFIDDISYCEFDNWKDYGYKNKTEVLNTYLDGKKWNSYECGKVTQILNNCDIYKSSEFTEAVAQILTIYTNRSWQVDSIHGFSQGDYAEVIHCGWDEAKEPYSKEFINELEAFFFGGYCDYNVTYKGESCGYFYTDREEAIEDFIADYGIKDRKNVIFHGCY